MHMPSVNCAGCQKELSSIERRKMGTVKNAVLLSAVAGVAAIVLFGPGLALGWPLLCLAFALSPMGVLAIRSGIRKKLANHRLLPTSTLQLLPAAVEGSAALANTKESAYDARRRRNKSKRGRGSGGGIRAVFMTRGGYFYQ
jgi:hypothetical protein